MRHKLTMQRRKCPVCKRSIAIIAGKFCTHGIGFDFCPGSNLPQKPKQAV